MAAPIGKILKSNIFTIKGSVCRSSILYTQTRNLSEHQRPLCRTTESDPTKHHKGHEALFYNINKADYEKYYVPGQRPHCGRLCKAFNERCVMVRKPALEVKQYLDATNYNMPVLRYILYGKLGSGKTTTLSHLMHYCGVNDWLLIHVPFGATFVKSYKEQQLSQIKPGRVDSPLDAAEWLTYFTNMNKKFLETNEPKCSGSYTWTKREKVEPGTPLQEIIEFALGRQKFASDALGIILKELKEQTSQKKFRTLVAIDGVNAFFEPTLIRHLESEGGKPRSYYHASELSVVQHFKKMLRNDWRNGAVICTVDVNASTTFNNESDLPLYLLHQEGFEVFDPFVPIHVPEYSDKEAYSCIEYFLDRKWIQNPAGSTDEGKQEILFLSGKNPYEMYNVTRAW